METYELICLGEGNGNCLFLDDQGGKDLEIESISAAATHAQFRANGEPAILRILNPDRTVRSERVIPPWSHDYDFGISVGSSWGWF